MKFRKALYLGASTLAFIIVFAVDLIGKNFEFDIGGLRVARDILVLLAFALLYLYLDTRKFYTTLLPAKRLSLVMIYSVIAVLVSGLLWGVSESSFDIKGDSLIPLTFGQVFVATTLGLGLGIFAVFVFRLLRGLVLFRRKRGTERNFLLYGGIALLTAVSSLFLEPLETGTTTSILFGFACLFAAINSFRMPWIVYLTKREKLIGLVYSFISFLAFLGLNIMLISQASLIRLSLLYHSHPMHEFILLVTLFGNIYAGMAFVSTLFHLPTAEAFERKSTEIASLHNLSRLVTQVFNFDQLVETVTSMTLQVCEAKSCWLEIIHYADEHEKARILSGERLIESAAAGNYVARLAGKKNIDDETIDVLVLSGERSLRDEVLVSRKPIVVDDLTKDQRFKGEVKPPGGSLVVVPLVSHSGTIGILYALKDMPFGFFKDDVDVISAFADQATVAIENSRLIKKSIERERLLREVTLAQEIQRKLLPQSLPRYPALEIDAVSEPAFEVGGDYYDAVELGDKKIGVAVGDVSGKGISAAFYMSEMKGIFQSLSRLYPSPREFMIKANEALASSIDKHSFVSLIYAVIDVPSSRLTLARAGHCPLLHISGDQATYLRPNGMGLGLSNGSSFEMHMEEVSIDLKKGDICVFYTDGVTEARNGDDEFGYERLLQTILDSRDVSAGEMKNKILESVKAHAASDENDDDRTVLIVKWLGE